MLPLIVGAAAELGKAAISADAKSEQVMFTNPASGGGVQSLGAITVGNRQVGGTGNAAGATSANPTATSSAPSSALPSPSEFYGSLSQGEKYALIGAVGLLVLAVVYKTLK